MIMTTEKKILVVDDCLITRKIVASILSHAGYEVVEALDGIDALEKISTDSFHLVISDLNMPNLDGIGLIRSIRADAINCSVPIVMLTSEAFEAHRWGCGVSRWVQKPFDPTNLLSVVMETLERAQQD